MALDYFSDFLKKKTNMEEELVNKIGNEFQIVGHYHKQDLSKRIPTIPALNTDYAINEWWLRVFL